jgi:ribose-phosphate pyrophosphokinase
MTNLVVPLPGNEALAAAIGSRLRAESGSLQMRNFPDGETYLRYQQELSGRTVLLVCSLNAPDPKFLPLLFAADAARDLGAAKVILVAPYLCYMRQDRRFNPGEAITSISFARRLSSAVDGLVTVDPHLHRYRSLDEIYSLPSRVVHSAGAIARWISQNQKTSFLIGPDIESEQWVRDVAQRAGTPYQVLRKERFGDRNVKIEVPDLSHHSGRTPILIDDIVSSGRTMIEAARQLKTQGFSSPICIAVHALFSPATERQLREIASHVVSTNTVAHSTNDIDLSDSIAEKLLSLLG